MLSYLAHRLASTFLVMTSSASCLPAPASFGGRPAAIIAAITLRRSRSSPSASGWVDDPLLVQFGRWAFRVIQGDLGVSIFSNAPVSVLFIQRLERRFRWRC